MIICTCGALLLNKPNVYANGTIYYYKCNYCRAGKLVEFIEGNMYIDRNLDLRGLFNES